MERRFGLFGAGNLGISISSALHKTGIAFQGVFDVDAGKAHEAAAILGCEFLPEPELARVSDLLLLAVPDREIAILRTRIGNNIDERNILVHFSGVLGSDILNHGLALSAHPTQTFPNPRLGEDVFKDVIVTLEGSEQAAKVFSGYMQKIGARTIMLDAGVKSLYHAMCVTASNLVVALLKMAEDMGKDLGIEDDLVAEIIRKLAWETVENARKTGSLGDALSGPVRRLDKDTIKKNLEVLNDLPDELTVYKLLSRKLMDIVKADDLKQAGEIEDLLS